MKADALISEIGGVNEKFVRHLLTLNIRTIRDLFFHFPFRYDDFSRVVPAAELKIGEVATVSGVVKRVRSTRSWKRKMAVTEAVVADDSGGVRAVWFNQPFVGKVLKPGQRINLSGKLTLGKNGAYFSAPAYEIVGGNGRAKHTAGLVSVYPETRGLTSRGIRYLINLFLNRTEKLPDTIPEHIRKNAGLPEINDALRKIHFPESPGEAEEAKKRFAFEDLFLMQLASLSEKLKLSQCRAYPIEINAADFKTRLDSLPFELTASQKKSLAEILNDVARGRPMNRLLEGDVGSGKTVVAALAALAAADNGFQTAFMAPTEILARQHFKTLTKMFPHFEGGIGLLTGSEARICYGHDLESASTKAVVKKEAKNGHLKITIGTHSLIAKGKKSTGLELNKPALVVVDEQHRFGVNQRQTLASGKKTVPHFLSMSATPIPRTLALAVFGDLDLSIIDELPKGRKKILTKVVAPENRNKAYDFIREQIKKGRQAFVICPRIEQTTDDQRPTAGNIGKFPAAGRRTPANLEIKSVKEEYEKLSKKVFPDLKIAMLHGKMKAKEKEEIMKKFAGGKIDVLVSTSVVEVGVDVPNATIMMIESADRFGLASLHQFRGRVGRGEHQSFCLLFTDSVFETTRKRLEAVSAAKNGFELAERDLEIRGPGELLGKEQSGLPDLMMRALKNAALIKEARREAEKIIAKDSSLKQYPLLQNRLLKFKEKIHLE
ncbi:MAG: ATP-dependent DNA helicase RecG [Parcubacteria group bacterium]|nr:ATP-dependent DNA helicase RecG [Parcubacteria group bacterium]